MLNILLAVVTIPGRPVHVNSMGLKCMMCLCVREGGESGGTQLQK